MKWLAALLVLVAVAALWWFVIGFVNPALVQLASLTSGILAGAAAWTTWLLCDEAGL
ncbi:UNVERIFIED_ORG: uncharacterized membrane protein YuzA (DUF378 family) [Arthrobacter sp. UYEF1]